MPKREEVLQQMIAFLSASDTEWDIQVGSPEYKILESVAQQVEHVSYNSTLLDYHFDVDSKVGIELDMFMALFGFSRIRGKRATGQITFGMKNAATQDYQIPRGTQVMMPSTSSSPAIYFTTTVDAVLTQNSREVSVPIQAVLVGTAGNVAAGAINAITTNLGSISYCYNATETAGGRNAESDADLRDRWRRTVFRNMSGTEDQFLGVVYNESAFVKRANLVGPVERYSEQIQILPPIDLTTATPWVGSGTITADVITFGGNDVNNFSATTSENQVWIAICNSITDAVEAIALVEPAPGSIAEGDATVPLSASPGLTGSKTFRQVYISYNNDIQYVFPQGGEVVTYNTSGTNLVNVAIPSDAIDSVANDYYYGTYTSLVYNPLDVDENTTPAPTGPFLFLSETGGAKVGNDSIVTLEYEYTPDSSRNIPGSSTVNRIDIFNDGVDEQFVTEQVPFPAHINSHRFSPTGDITAADFIRDDGITTPEDGSYFIPLAKTPVVTPPVSITALSSDLSPKPTTYYLGEDYYLVTKTDKLEGSPRSIVGLEWRDAGGNVHAGAEAVFAVDRDLASNSKKGPLKKNYAYAYVLTWINAAGEESLPSEPISIIMTDNGHNILTIPNIDLCDDGAINASTTTATIRKVYRTKGIKGGSQGDAETLATKGEVFLVKTITNPNEINVTDKMTDKSLITTNTPPATPPAADTPMELKYSYNKLIERLDKSVELVRLVGMDTLVHAAYPFNTRINLAIVPTYNVNIEGLRNDILTTLRSWADRKRFMGDVQVADIVGILEGLPGIDNVRLSKADEVVNDEQIIKIFKKDTSAEGAGTSNVDEEGVTSEDDIWFTLDGMTTGPVKWDAIYDADANNGFYFDADILRDIFEGLPYIDGGARGAAMLNGAMASTTSTFTIDNVLDHNNFEDTGKDFPIYMQIDNEIMQIVGYNMAGTGTVIRGMFGSAITDHADDSLVDILGDIAIAIRSEEVDVNGVPEAPVNDGSQESKAMEVQISFIPNGFTQNNDWGQRFIESITPHTGGTATVSVSKKRNGCGYGIEQIGPDGITTMQVYTDDIYMTNRELPVIFDVGVVLRARNSF